VRQAGNQLHPPDRLVAARERYAQEAIQAEQDRNGEQA
jgi:hypothetical protein